LAIVSKPEADGTHNKGTTRQTLERACLAEAGHRFMQANQTPCFQSPLWEIFGELGICCHTFDEVLEGTFLIPDMCDRYTKQVLQHLQQPPEAPETRLPTLEKYIYGWSHAKEEISSSYSTIHFGHYVAGAQDELIAHFNAQLAMLLAATGYSPNHWQHGLNMMLEKIPGNIKVEWLWIILLFKANCNQNNKWLGQAFMKIAESANLLASKNMRTADTKMPLHNV